MSRSADKFLWITFILFVLVLPVSSFISARILVLLLILSLVFGERKFILLDLLKSSWDIFFYLLVLVLGFIYSTDEETGMRTLETSFALLTLPIVCFRIQAFSRDRLNSIFLFFSLGIFVAGLICLVNAFVTYKNNGHISQVFFFYDFFVYF